MSTARLDDEELLHLALRASDEDRHEDAISYLKRALDVAPNNAKARYMLGAEHAQIGLYDRAAEEMAEAVKLDPSLVTAQFQLGLLHLTSGRVKEAEDVWKSLDGLDAEHPLYLFKSGLLHLVRDEFDECERFLRRGIEANQANQALNNDMARVLKDVEGRKPAAAPKTETAERPKATAPKHVLLSAYKQNRSEDKDN